MEKLLNRRTSTYINLLGILHKGCLWGIGVWEKSWLYPQNLHASNCLKFKATGGLKYALDNYHLIFNELPSFINSQRSKTFPLFLWLQSKKTKNFSHSKKWKENKLLYFINLELQTKNQEIYFF